MKHSILFRAAIATSLAGFCLQAPVLAQTAAAPAKAPKKFEILKAADFPPASMLPAPPAAGSAAEASDLAQVRALIANASPARLQQARWDADHEDPSIFDATLGISLKTLPTTWALLSLIQNDANQAANLSKDFFNRMRPYGVDSALPNCEAEPGKPWTKKPTRSYPSGHSTLGYSVGFALAQLAPERGAAILDRARDYALSREYCGQHFASDTEASHVIGSLAADRLLARPDMAERVAAARAELAAALARSTR